MAVASPEVNATTAWDVIVIGGGPAGSATAITLAKFGQRVLLVDEHISAKLKLGESLSPQCAGFIKQFLGPTNETEECLQGMFRTAGNASVWADAQTQITDFFFTQTGFGYCVDRVAFDEALRTSATAAGVTVLTGLRLESCTRITDNTLHWQLSFGKDSPTYHARYVVDCTGRRAVVARMLGSAVEETDTLFAYARWFATSARDEDRYTRIEAGPQGWWYSNRLPAYEEDDVTQRLVVFHTDKDLPCAKQAAKPDGFEEILDQSVHLKSWLHDFGYRPVGTIRGAAANSQRLASFCGDDWMAVGDSAQAYDPLSSQGIDKALRTGSHAGHLIHYALSEQHDGQSLGPDNHYIGQYVLQQEQLWNKYVSQRHFYYQMQPRWTDQPFWQRRQAS